MRNNKILLINTLFIERYASGFTNRFIGLWCHYNQNKKSGDNCEIHWLVNKSLWSKFFPGKQLPDNVTMVSANLKYFKYTSRLFYPFYIIYLFYKKKCSSIHVATSIVDYLLLVRLLNIFRIPYCITFAAASPEMAAYSQERMIKKWKKVLSLAKNVDVLNPKNTVNIHSSKKFISPNSFPYLPIFKNIPRDKFLNAERKDLIVFCGTFVHQKNPLLALDGFYEYIAGSERKHNAQLIMIGRGELKEMLVDKANQINNRLGSEAIVFKDESSLVDVLSEAKIFLSLQDFDNYPSQSLMEAMLFCNSIISIDNGDTRKLVDPAKNNILLQSKDPKALGEAIQSLLCNWELNTLNHDLIINNFTVEKFLDYFCKIHQTILKTKPVMVE
jgi:glycosyltransferase involved in cell wall biosynthesis